MWSMPSVPVPGDPGWDEDLAWLDRDPMTAEEREASLDHLCESDDDPSAGPEEYWDPGSCAPPPGEDELTADELAGIRAAAADEMLGLEAASTGRRGPGHPGSARVFPGESGSRAAGFGTGMAWDVAPGCAQLAVAADAAVDGGSGDWFGGVADHELIGLVCAWNRLEAAPVRSQGPRPRSHTQASLAGQAHHLHQPGLPPACQPVRLRTQHAI
jgi:hypothetical protein